MKKMALGLVAALGIISLTGCAEVERTQKNWKSSVTGGLNRKVEVYDNVGNVIKEYEGKIDVQYREDGTILFELDGKRIIVKNAIVIVEEQ